MQIGRRHYLPRPKFRTPSILVVERFCEFEKSFDHSSGTGKTFGNDSWSILGLVNNTLKKKNLIHEGK